ncbi:MAG: hypothetical protein E7665_05250 [Ruminococcaceae bacterium]|nr:hypothetical protein [Oscillospiraceae bacterium]
MAAQIDCGKEKHIMNKKISLTSLFLTILLIAFSITSCSSVPSAGTITAINEDGSMIITDNEGNTYTVPPYVAEETVETVKTTGIVNVYDHGAKGNGTDDDTSSIQEAVNALSTGGVLYIPSGTYKITAPISFEKGDIIIEGNGASTILVHSFAPSDSESADKASLFSFADGISNVQIRDLSMTYAAGSEKKGSTNGIYFGKCENVFVEDVDIRQFSNSGILFSETAKDFSTHISVKNCILSDNYAAGINIGHVDGIAVTGCDLYKNGTGKDTVGYGVYVSENASPKNIRVFGNRIYENSAAGIYITSGEDIDILNNNVVLNKQYGIYASGEKINFVVISNNFVTDMIASAANNIFKDKYFCAIYTGATSESTDIGSFTVMNNTVKNFNLTTGSAYGFVVETCGNTFINFTDNIFEGNTVEGAVLVKDNSKDSPKNDIVFTNNMFRIRNSAKNGIVFNGAQKLNISQNRLQFDKISGEACIYVNSNAAQVITSYNIIHDATSKAKDIAFSKDPSVLLRDGDLFNGKDIA